MGQRAEELRVEIEDTRADMSTTLDAIGDRMSPNRIMERRKNRMLGSVRSLRERVMGTAEYGVDQVQTVAHDATETVKEVPEMIRDRTEGAPVVAGAIAFGFGFLMATVLPQPRAEREAEAKLLETAEPLTQQLVAGGQEMASHLKEQATDAARQLKDTASTAATAIGETARSAASDVEQAASNGGDGQEMPVSMLEADVTNGEGLRGAP